jgi:hypothetical protein
LFFFVISRSPEGDNPLIIVAPCPNDGEKLSLDQRDRQKAILVLKPSGYMQGWPAIEDSDRIYEIEAPLRYGLQALRFVPFEHGHCIYNLSICITLNQANVCFGRAINALFKPFGGFDLPEVAYRIRPEPADQAD